MDTEPQLPSLATDRDVRDCDETIDEDNISEVDNPEGEITEDKNLGLSKEKLEEMRMDRLMIRLDLKQVKKSREKKESLEFQSFQSQTAQNQEIFRISELSDEHKKIENNVEKLKAVTEVMNTVLQENEEENDPREQLKRYKEMLQKLTQLTSSLRSDGDDEDDENNSDGDDENIANENEKETKDEEEAERSTPDNEAPNKDEAKESNNEALTVDVNVHNVEDQIVKVDIDAEKAAKENIHVEDVSDHVLKEDTKVQDVNSKEITDNIIKEGKTQVGDIENMEQKTVSSGNPLNELQHQSKNTFMRSEKVEKELETRETKPEYDVKLSNCKAENDYMMEMQKVIIESIEDNKRKHPEKSVRFTEVVSPKQDSPEPDSCHTPDESSSGSALAGSLSVIEKLKIRRDQMMAEIKATQEAIKEKEEVELAKFLTQAKKTEKMEKKYLEGKPRNLFMFGKEDDFAERLEFLGCQSEDDLYKDLPQDTAADEDEGYNYEDELVETLDYVDSVDDMDAVD